VKNVTLTLTFNYTFDAPLRTDQIEHYLLSCNEYSISWAVCTFLTKSTDTLLH